MAVKSFPDISPDANPTFTLESNTSSFESTLNKNVQHMELPGARWRGSVAFSNRTRQEANKIKAFMARLGGQVGRFYLTPFDAYQSGTMSGTGVVDGAVPFGASTIPTKGWEGGQDKLFEAGDYIEFGGELKIIPEDVAAPQSYIEYTGTNYMPSPFDPSGWYGATTDTDLSYTSIVESNPSGEAFIGEFEYTGPSSPVLTRSTDQSFLSGERIGVSIIAKSSTFPWVRALFEYTNGTDLSSVYVNTNTGAVGESTGAPYEINTEELSDGYRLIEVRVVAPEDESYSGDFWMQGDDGPGGAFNPSIGDTIQCQAAYFGKADDWPAQLLATADIPIAPPLRKSLLGGESITVTEPKGKFYLGSNDQSWDINVNGVQDMGFDFIEDVN